MPHLSRARTVGCNVVIRQGNTENFLFEVAAIRNKSGKQKAGAFKSQRALPFSSFSEARVKAEAAKAEAQRLEAIQRRNQEMLVERERLHQQQVRRMERNRARDLAMYRRAQERRLQVLLSYCISGLSASPSLC